MKIYCGTDIIEIDRIKKSIDRNTRAFLNKIYTQAEIQYCESSGAAKYEHFAARFAAKEAIFKAVSDVLDNKYDISWKDVEILNDENGRPFVHFINSKFELQCDISLSHCKSYATAMVIVYKGE